MIPQPPALRDPTLERPLVVDHGKTKLVNSCFPKFLLFAGMGFDIGDQPAFCSRLTEVSDGAL